MGGEREREEEEAFADDDRFIPQPLFCFFVETLN